LNNEDWVDGMNRKGLQNMFCWNILQPNWRNLVVFGTRIKSKSTPSWRKLQRTDRKFHMEVLK